MTTVTFEADDAMVEAARARARAEETTLEEALRYLLEEYAGRAERDERARGAMAFLDEIAAKIDTGGRKFTREEMNER